MVTLICRLQKKTISFKEKKPLTQHNNFNPRYNCYKLYRKYNKLVNGFQKLSAIQILVDICSVLLLDEEHLNQMGAQKKPKTP